MLATMWTNLCHHPCPAVCVRAGQTLFWTGSGICLGLFVPATHSAVAGCVIQP